MQVLLLLRQEQGWKGNAAVPTGRASCGPTSAHHTAGWADCAADPPQEPRLHTRPPHAACASNVRARWPDGMRACAYVHRCSKSLGGTRMHARTCLPFFLPHPGPICCASPKQTGVRMSADRPPHRPLPPAPGLAGSAVLAQLGGAGVHPHHPCARLDFQAHGGPARDPLPGGAAQPGHTGEPRMQGQPTPAVTWSAQQCAQS